MTVTLADLPEQVTTTLITGRFTSGVVDSDDPGADPDEQPLAGLRVTITPRLSKARLLGVQRPSFIALLPFSVSTNPDGEIYNPAHPDAIGVRVISSDNQVLDPTGFTYRIVVSSPDTAIADWVFEDIAAIGDHIDLIDVATTPPFPGTPTLTEWMQLVADARAARDAAQGYAEAAEQHAADATEAAGRAQEAAAVSEQAIEAASHAAQSAGRAQTAADAAAQSADSAHTSYLQAYAARSDTLNARAETLAARDEAVPPVITGLSWAGAVDLSEHTSPAVLHATLTGNVTVTLPTPPGARGYTITLVLTQDATGGRTISFPGAALAYAVPITLTAAPHAVDVIHLMWTGVQWVVLPAAMSIGIPAGGGV
ncbi:hypothetical protein [uncultured Aeromicrobium sp.]|uniref:hypothetical protein n=1 Tax=uncultured Aeromicrobium sp. TaxID=337820 RepID=UPI0025CEAC7D|nr:hypothetical protein [uncultured Aeromicrobium sp.]